MKKTIVSMMMIFGLFWFSQAAVLDDAVTWMNTNWLTIFTTIKDYQPNNYIRRDEAAKLFVKFAKIVQKDTYKKTAEECKFSDLNNAHADLKDIVVESCRLGIFQWANGKFMPRNSITNEQAVAVLVRILVGNQSETGVSYWSENYYKKANEMWMLSQVNITDRKLAATRGNIAIILAANSPWFFWWVWLPMPDDLFLEFKKWPVVFQVPNNWSVISEERLDTNYNYYRIQNFPVQTSEAPYEYNYWDFFIQVFTDLKWEKCDWKWEIFRSSKTYMKNNFLVYEWLVDAVWDMSGEIYGVCIYKDSATLLTCSAKDINTCKDIFTSIIL